MPPSVETGRHMKLSLAKPRDDRCRLHTYHSTYTNNMYCTRKGTRRLSPSEIQYIWYSPVETDDDLAFGFHNNMCGTQNPPNPHPPKQKKERRRKLLLDGEEGSSIRVRLCQQQQQQQHILRVKEHSFLPYLYN